MFLVPQLGDQTRESFLHNTSSEDSAKNTFA